MRPITLLIFLVLAQCLRDETVAAYGAGDTLWVLRSIDGRDFGARATLTFPEPGGISGQAPCNRFSGRLDAPYPWFGLTGMSATSAACPDLSAESVFFAALEAMTQSEVSGDVLILRNDSGGEMVFTAGG